MKCNCCNTDKPESEFYLDEPSGFCRKCVLENQEFVWKEFKEKWDTWSVEQKRKHFQLHETRDNTRRS